MTKKAIPNPVRGDKPLEFHPLADIFPLMEGDAFAAFAADVREHGVREHITLYEGKILDGRNRYRAWQECRDEGHTCDWRNFQSYGNTPAERHEDALAFVISANIHRRHLNGEQKRDLIVKLLKATPQLSDRQIGKTVKADNKTVAIVRADMEGREEIPHVAKRTDTKGREQPARKTAATETKALVPAPGSQCGTVPVRDDCILEDASGKKKKISSKKAAVEPGMPRLMADLDRVKAILVERIGLEGLTLVWTAS